MKKMLTVVLAAIMLLTVNPVMASSFPNFDFNGSILTQYRWDTDDSSTDKNGGRIFFRLNATSDLSKDVSVFARFAAEGLNGDKFSQDFDPGHYSQGGAASIDRFGIIVKGKDFTYKFGRQDGMLGQGLLYDSTTYMGTQKAALDGLIAWGKTGATNLTFVLTRVWGDYANDINAYAIDASYNPTKQWKIGGTLSKLDNVGVPARDTNFWAVNTSYTAGKAVFGAEYGQSSADSANKGYAISANYNIDEKNTAYIIYSKVEDNMSMADFTAYDDNGKGMYYGLNHKISKDCDASLFYKDMKNITSNQKYTSLRATVTYKF